MILAIQPVARQVIADPAALSGAADFDESIASADKGFNRKIWPCTFSRMHLLKAFWLTH
jgi:hypothetical protein